jgi:hypothetical protein
MAALLTVGSAQAQALPKVLPQGLTCGLSYMFPDTGGLINDCVGMPTVMAGAQLTDSPARHYHASIDGDANQLPGEGGFGVVAGFAHQALDPCPPENPACLPEGFGVATNGADSTNFSLPQGAACGFHHTALSSLDETCMGYNPAQFFGITGDRTVGMPGCPAGWTPRRAYDAGSADTRGILRDAWWVWCSYDDPHHLSATGNNRLPVAAMGVACGIAHSDPVKNDQSSTCMGYYTSRNAGAVQVCPAGYRASNWFDDTEPAGHGLDGCAAIYTTFPTPAPAFGAVDASTVAVPAVSGWAFDPNAPASPIGLVFYANGPVGTGTLMGQALTNTVRSDVNSQYNISGTHGFSFVLPQPYTSHSTIVYAYVVSAYNAAEPLLQGAPVHYLAPSNNPTPQPTCPNCAPF